MFSKIGQRAWIFPLIPEIDLYYLKVMEPRLNFHRNVPVT